MTDLFRWLISTFQQWGACVAISAPLVAIASWGKTGVGRKLVWLAAFFLGCLLLVRLETFWGFLRSPWQAMLLEGVFALGVITTTCSLSFYGLTLKIDQRVWRDIAIAIFLLVVFVVIRNNLLRLLWLANQERASGWEFILYQATLPGIAEELVYRGVIQSQLNGLYSKPWKLFGVSLGWGFAITAVLFWAIHAFRVENLTLSFYWQTVTMQLVASFVFGWLRERSGSIIPGIIAHNLVNLVWMMA